MNTLIIERKKYVVLPQAEYETLLVKAASKTTPVRKLSMNEGKKLAYKLIDKWANKKVCSLGQISHALYEVGGQYRRSM